jgi:hypothetical protein
MYMRGSSAGPSKFPAVDELTVTLKDLLVLLDAASLTDAVKL